MTRPQALVYLYTFWDEQTKAMKTSTVYATIPAIHNGLGIPLYEQVLTVDAFDLEGGIYDPKHAPAPDAKVESKA